jgi:CBS domain-containing protein
MTDIYRQRVKDIMTRDIVSIHSDEDVHEALEMMAENRVTTLPVVNRRNKCVGMLSTTDLIELTRDFDDDLYHWERADESSHGDFIAKLSQSVGHERIDSLMTEQVATARLETPVVAAAREMLRNRVHHLPVLDGQERLVGIVSTMDILSSLSDGTP